VITMSPGDAQLEFSPSGTYDRAALSAQIREGRPFCELADDPHQFALGIWHAS
jgi:hypothetical protein